jgi:hypothetical protein
MESSIGINVCSHELAGRVNPIDNGNDRARLIYRRIDALAQDKAMCVAAGIIELSCNSVLAIAIDCSAG